MNKSDGNGVEPGNSFTLGVTGVAESGLDEATSLVSQNYFRSRDNHFRFDRNRKYCRLSVNTIRKPLDGRKVLPVTCDVDYSHPAEPEFVFRS